MLIIVIVKKLYKLNPLLMKRLIFSFTLMTLFSLVTLSYSQSTYTHSDFKLLSLYIRL